MAADAKRVIREWNREIEAELRRQALRDDGGWKIVVWIVLEVLWLVVLFACLGLLSPMPW